MLVLRTVKNNVALIKKKEQVNEPSFDKPDY